MASSDLKKRQRDDYYYHLDFRTRWSDNDMYHHLNNNVYGFLIDSIVNQYLIEECGRNPASSDEIGLVISSHCDFFGSMAYPGIAKVGLRVNKLGRTSATYEVGIFEQGSADVKAVGGFTHVFVDRNTNRPQAQGMGKKIREGLQKLLAKESPKL